MRVADCLFVTALAAVTLPACFESSAQQTQREAPAQAPAVPVTVAPVVEKDMPLEISLIGTTEAYNTVVVRAQITGELTSVNFEQGDDVKAGQVLFTLDRRPLEAALNQAEANLARDSAQADQARVSAQRTQDLADRGLVPREQVDQTHASATALAATVASDRAAVENASVQLEYATIRAPIAGRTGALMVSAGNLVRANDQAPLAIINQVTPTYVSFAISETLLPEFKRYMAKGALRVEATPPSDEGPAAAGQITFIDNTVDQTTGTIKIKGTFPNLDRRLWPGQFVNVIVRLGTDVGATVVPSIAVQTGPEGQYVFVVTRERTVEMRTITIARTAGAETVIKGGVKPGETVVTDGQLRLVPGSRVNIKEARAPEVVS